LIVGVAKGNIFSVFMGGMHAVINMTKFGHNKEK